MIGDSMQAGQRDASGSPIKTTRRPEVFFQHGTSCFNFFPRNCIDYIAQYCADIISMRATRTTLKLILKYSCNMVPAAYADSKVNNIHLTFRYF